MIKADVFYSAVAAVMFKKAEWEDDWEAAVKKVFNTSENKNLDCKLPKIDMLRSHAAFLLARWST